MTAQRKISRITKNRRDNILRPLFGGCNFSLFSLLLFGCGVWVPSVQCNTTTSSTFNETSPQTEAASAEEDASSILPVNPLEKGCLRHKLPHLNLPLRVCNSDDATLPMLSYGSVCRPSEFDYLEIRIKCQDWESVLFGSWILQILFSEILQVPTTLETGLPDAVMQFYDPHDKFEFGTTSNNLLAFQHASDVNGDCRLLEQNWTANTTEDYKSCAHVIPEVWTARSEQVSAYIEQGILEAPYALGALGMEGWYIPKFTAEYDPSLTSWIGLQSQENRHKLAQTFKRPTTWLDYCEFVSTNNCTMPDDTALRYPQDDLEKNRYFLAPDFMGYFRYTPQNNWITWPNNCTGHIGDFPCGWGGSLQAQCYHLNIALESNGHEPYSGGYTYSQLSQLWRAANHTRNHVAMMWVTPDPLYEEFLGTDFEFVKVTLPPPTQQCIENRINPEHRCVEDPALRLGTPDGVCDESARPLHKLLLASLWQDPAVVPLPLKHPAHAVLTQFSLTELQINDMFRYWQQIPTWSLEDSPREAICQWVVDHIDDLQRFIPRTYPRTLQDHALSQRNKALLYATTAMGSLATLLVVITICAVYRHQHRRVFRYAQVEFLYLLLFGSTMVAIGAILVGLPQPTNASCQAQIWLIGLGYTLELVPLLVKVAAINRLMSAAQRMRRVKLQRSSLHGGVALISVLVATFLMVWTLVDSPQKTAQYELTDNTIVMGNPNYENDNTNNDGMTLMHDYSENTTATTATTTSTSNDTNTNHYSWTETTIVQVQYHCQSQTNAWNYSLIGWNLILILCATALAFQSRAVKQDFNEAQVLSRLIYAHFLFILLRVMSLFLNPDVAGPMLSMVLSLDTICMVLVYFVPKFLADDRAGVIGGRTSTAFFGSSFVGQSSYYANNNGRYRTGQTNHSSGILNHSGHSGLSAYDSSDGRLSLHSHQDDDQSPAAAAAAAAATTTCPKNKTTSQSHVSCCNQSHDGISNNECGVKDCNEGGSERFKEVPVKAGNSNSSAVNSGSASLTDRPEERPSFDSDDGSTVK